MEKTIQLNSSDDIIKLEIVTKDGKKTGEYLEFNLEDIELLDRLQRMNKEYKQNYAWINNELTIISKKQDFKKKGELMSNNQMLEYNAIKEFYKKQTTTFNLFLGENGVEKLLYGRKLEWETLEEIRKLINEQIGPQLNISMDAIKNKIKSKYKLGEEIEVLE